MENRDLFTMRELGDRDLEQFNSLLKYAFQVTSDEMLKTGWQDFRNRTLSSRHFV